MAAKTRGGAATAVGGRLARFFVINPVWHVVVPIIGLVVFGIASIAVYLPEAMQAAAIDSAYRGNLEVAEQIKITRGYYTRNVVAKAIETGALKPSYQHENNPRAIPLPATFVKDISDLLKERDTSLSLVSPYPWPHRTGRMMDDFQLRAWEAFQKDPKAIFSRQEVRDGKRVLRVAVADQMTGPTCVACHNSDPRSIKRDWKIGDVRAVMEVTKVVEPYLAAAEARSQLIVSSVGAGGAMVALILVFFTMGATRHMREKLAADEHLHYLARHDAMTGALNRDRFIQLLAEALKGDHAVAVHYVDLDRFKEANDKFGHSVGDELVRAVAGRLKSLLGRNEVLARMGGDEFVIAQLKIGSRQEATDRAALIIKALSMPFYLNSHHVSISASVGVMVTGSEPMTADDLLKAADIALYRAKAAGRDRFVLFSPDMRDELNARRELEDKLRIAARYDRFDLHFQPICNARNGEVEGFEALIRLPDESGKFISPAVFIPVTEKIGLIPKIGAWVIQRACAVAATWPDGLTVSVNLSPQQFAANADGIGSVSQIVRTALAETGLPAHRLELEITEGLLFETTDTLLAELHELKALGVSLVLDDFGTGYSSLSYLWKLPFDKIKLDRSFAIASSDRASTAGPVIKTITALGRTLDMRLTAEGIETGEQAIFFAQLGYDQLQGYLFGRPMPEADVAAAILNAYRGRAQETYEPLARSA